MLDTVQCVRLIHYTSVMLDTVQCMRLIHYTSIMLDTVQCMRLIHYTSIMLDTVQCVKCYTQKLLRNPKFTYYIGPYVVSFQVQSVILLNKQIITLLIINNINIIPSLILINNHDAFILR